MARLSVTQEQISFILEMGRAGATQGEIREAVGSTKKVIGRIIREAGIKTPKQNPNNKNLPRDCPKCNQPMIRYGGKHQKWACRPCKAEYNVGWSDLNQNEIKAKRVIRHAENRYRDNARSKSRKAGLTPEQRRAEAAEDRRKHRDHIRAYHRSWVRARRIKDPGYQREYQRDWQKANRAKCKVYTVRWSKKNPGVMSILWSNARARRKARGVIGSHTAAEWRAIVKKQKSKCQECGIKCIQTKDNSDPRQLTKDHIIPRRYGGTEYAFNLQVLCHPCNSRKWARIKSGAKHSIFDRMAVA